MKNMTSILLCIFSFIFFVFIPENTGLVNSRENPPNFPYNILLKIGTYENWSNELKVENLWIATPSTVKDVITLTNWAHLHGYTLRAKGFMHNWSPLTVTATNDNKHVVLIDTTKNLVSMKLTTYTNVKTVKVQTGASMINLLTFLERNGLGLYAVPAPGDVTVGGVLAIGGHGTGIPAFGEKPVPGLAYGTLSNLIVSFTAVVWDDKADEYVLKTFSRSDVEAKAFLVHFGRTFITEVTLMVGPNYNLRCVSYTYISADELFADPNKTESRTFASFLEKNGRAEVIVFPFSKNSWLKVWSITPNKPLFSRWVSHPYNYPFSDTIPKPIAKMYSDISNGATFLNPILSAAQFGIVKAGLLSTLSTDIWGPSKNLLLYVKPSTLRMTANGYTIITRRDNIQRVISTLWSYYKYLSEDYASAGKFPLTGQLEIRTSLLDQPGIVKNGDPPTFSSIHPILDNPEYNVAIWFDILSIPNAPYLNEAMAKFENFLYTTFNGIGAIIRPEWSKGWAYTDKSAWSNETIYKDFVPITFPSINGTDGFNWAVSILNKYDPHRIFTNDFLDKFLVLANEK